MATSYNTDKVSLSKNATNDLGTLTAASAKDGEKVNFDGDNEKMLFICVNDNQNTKPVYIKFLAGDRWQSSIGSLTSTEISAGTTYAAFVLETARFKNADGDLTFELKDGAGDGASNWGATSVSDFKYDLLELP